MATDKDYMDALAKEFSFLEEDDISQYSGGWSNKVDNDIVVTPDYVELKPTHFMYTSDELWQSCCDVLESREGWKCNTDRDNLKIYSREVRFGPGILSTLALFKTAHTDGLECIIVANAGYANDMEWRDHFMFSNHVRDGGSSGLLEIQPCRLTQCQSLLASFYKDVHDYYMENFGLDRASDLQTKCDDLPIQKDVQENKDCGPEF